MEALFNSLPKADQAYRACQLDLNAATIASSTAASLGYPEGKIARSGSGTSSIRYAVPGS